ncbi:MAG: glycosyltransferase family 4 protein [Salegentibacter mishustinae]|nr:glycosyltransferase family 4 protein [Salegentibacter mishustinae]
MKILFVIDTIQGSGAERSLVDIASHFKKHNAVFVHIYKGDMLKPILEKAGIKVYSLNLSGPRNYSNAARELQKVYDIEKPDIIHSTLFNSDAITRKLKSKYPISLVSSFVNNSYNKLRFKNQSLGTQVKLRLVQLYDAYTSRKVDFFISNSETIKKAKARSTYVSLDKVKVIYRGRDIEKFKNLSTFEDLNKLKDSLGISSQKVLLNVSRLIERKGQMDLVNAMPSVLKQHPNTILLIAGHGVYEDKLNKRIKELGLEENIKLLGRRMDVAQLLLLANVFVYPSYFEGLPGALIEAMLAEKVIVCSNIPENLECVDEESAVIFERGDVDELSKKVNYAIDNEGELKALGIQARKIAAQKFDLGSIAAEYEATYEQIIEKLKQ